MYNVRVHLFRSRAPCSDSCCPRQSSPSRCVRHPFPARYRQEGRREASKTHITTQTSSSPKQARIFGANSFTAKRIFSSIRTFAESDRFTLLRTLIRGCEVLSDIWGHGIAEEGNNGNGDASQTHLRCRLDVIYTNTVTNPFLEFQARTYKSLNDIQARTIWS